MKTDELKKILENIGVQSYEYNFDGKGRDDERICLVKKELYWNVYYSERGVHTTDKYFESEDEACDYILECFK